MTMTDDNEGYNVMK